MLPSLLPLLLDTPGYPFAPSAPEPPPEPDPGGGDILGPGAVGGDLSKIETGPSKVIYKGRACGHTQEGVKFTISPDLRERKVDEYGNHVVEMISQSDRAEVKAVFMEKDLTTIQTVYQMSYKGISSTVVGFGRRPGRRALDQAGELVLHPIGESDDSNDVIFYKAAVSGSEEVNFGTVTQDRVFGVTFQMLIDESRSDGRMIGQIGVG